MLGASNGLESRIWVLLCIVKVATTKWWIGPKLPYHDTLPSKAGMVGAGIPPTGESSHRIAATRAWVAGTSVCITFYISSCPEDKRIVRGVTCREIGTNIAHLYVNSWNK